jgi:hypothetical protein
MIPDKRPGSSSPDNDPRVDQFMHDNGIQDRAEAIKILKDEGHI